MDEVRAEMPRAPAAARPSRGRSRPSVPTGGRVRYNPHLRVKPNPEFARWRDSLPAVLPPPTILQP